MCQKITNSMIPVHLTAVITTRTASFSSSASEAQTNLGPKPEKIRLCGVKKQNIFSTQVHAGVVLVFQPHSPVYQSDIMLSYR